MKTLLALLFLAVSSGAADYYVATNGSDSNPGSFASPFLTVKKAARTTTLNPGDTVYIRGGTYTGYANEIDLPAGTQNNGTSNALITVKAYEAERPVITGIDGTAFHYYALVLKSKEWWKFDGITWSNNYGHGYFENITNVTFTNCVFTAMPTNGWDLGTSAYATVWLFGSSQLNRFYNCEFSWWGDVGETNEQYKAHGSALSLGNETSDDQTWYNLWDGCRFNNCGHDLTTISSGYNVFRNGTYHNEAWYPTNSYTQLLYNGGSARYQTNMYGAWAARIMKPGDAGTNMLDQRNVWENNTFIYAGPPPDSGGAFGIELATHKSIYRKNVIAYALAAGIYINTSGMTTRVESNAIYNNTIFGNGLSWVYGGDWMKSYSRGIDINTYEMRMTNNFLVNNIVWQNYPSNVHANVIIANYWRTNYSGDYGGLTYPAFVNTNGFGWTYDAGSLPNFRLTSASPCIDGAAWLATITSVSGSGTSFTVDNSLYFSDGNRVVEGDTIQLEGQTVTAVVTSNDITNNVLTFTPSLTWTNGQGVSLSYSGAAPDFGAFEFIGASATASTVTVGTLISP